MCYLPHKQVHKKKEEKFLDFPVVYLLQLLSAKPNTFTYVCMYVCMNRVRAGEIILIL